MANAMQPARLRRAFSQAHERMSRFAFFSTVFAVTVLLVASSAHAALDYSAMLNDDTRNFLKLLADSFSPVGTAWSTALGGDYCTTPPVGITCDAVSKLVSVDLTRVTSSLSADLPELPPTIVGSSVAVGSVSAFKLYVTGPLPSSWSRLTKLQIISLNNNNITGTLPETWSALSSLQSLFLYGNKIEGTLPADWSRGMSSLRVLELFENSLSGTLPIEWGNWTSITAIDLWSNKLEGPLPDSWSGMTKLETLGMYANMLNGTLPEGWNSLANLVTLDLKYNQIKSTLPSVWFAFPSLQTLDLRGNQITGNLPSSWGTGLAALVSLDLGENQITGVLPSTWSNLKSLQSLYLSSNKIGGPLPSAYITSIRWLYMGENQITGTLPATWYKCTNLQYLWLQNNQITGTLPPSWSSLYRLSRLYLYNNQISGSLPTAWYNMLGLSYLQLQNNSISGVLPSTWSQLRSLQYLFLQDNLIAGELPPEWSSMPSLQIANFSTNKIIGTLPDSWKSFNLLGTLSISRNLIDGTLPDSWGTMPSLKDLDLSHNSITGQLPDTAWANWPMLNTLAISHNQLEGTVHASWGGLTTLTSLNLQNNSLTGDLPEWPTFKSLQAVDLSNNLMGGSLSASWGNLLFTNGRVHLYGNHFCGCVPSLWARVAPLQTALNEMGDNGVALRSQRCAITNSCDPVTSTPSSSGVKKIYYPFTCSRNGTTWEQWNLCTSATSEMCFGDNVISVADRAVTGEEGYTVCEFAVCYGWYCTDGLVLLQNYITFDDDVSVRPGYNKIFAPATDSGFNAACYCAPHATTTGEIAASWDPFDRPQNEALRTVPGGLNYRYDDQECVAFGFQCADNQTHNLYKADSNCYCCPNRDQPYYYFPISTQRCKLLGSMTTPSPSPSTTVTPEPSESSHSTAPPTNSSATSTNSNGFSSSSSSGLVFSYFPFNCTRNGTTWQQWNLCTSATDTMCYGDNVVSATGVVSTPESGYEVCAFAECVGWYCKSDQYVVIQNFTVTYDTQDPTKVFHNIFVPGDHEFDASCYCAIRDSNTGVVDPTYEPGDMDQNEDLHSLYGGMRYRYDDHRCVEEGYACEDDTFNLFRSSDVCYCCANRDQPFYYYPVSLDMCKRLPKPQTSSSSSSSSSQSLGCGDYHQLDGGCGWHKCNSATVNDVFCQTVNSGSHNAQLECQEYPCAGVSCEAGMEVVYLPDTATCRCFTISAGCPSGTPQMPTCESNKKLSCGYVNCENATNSPFCGDLTPAQEAIVCSEYKCENMRCIGGNAIVYNAAGDWCSCNKVDAATSCPLQSEEPAECTFGIIGKTARECGYYDCLKLPITSVFCYNAVVNSFTQCADSPCLGRRCPSVTDTMLYHGATDTCRCYSSDWTQCPSGPYGFPTL